MISLYKTKNIIHTGKKRFPPFSLRKPFCLALALSLLLGGGGCSGKQTTTGQNTPPPLPTQQETAESFSVFLDDFFNEYVTSDSLSLHYTLLDPEAFQIEKPAVSFGEFSVDSLRASNRTATEYLTRLHAFSKESLQPEEQLTYELLEYALKHSAIPEGTELYDSPLGPTTGLQTQLPVLLAEYRFSSMEDVEEAVANFAAQCSRKLREQHTVCNSITIFAHTSRFREDLPQSYIYRTVQLTVPTNDHQELVSVAVKMLRDDWKDGDSYFYKKAGVIVWGISRDNAIQTNLFDTVNREKQAALAKAIDEINRKNGHNKIRVAVQGNEKGWQLKKEYISKQYTTNLDDVIVLKVK